MGINCNEVVKGIQSSIEDICNDYIFDVNNIQRETGVIKGLIEENIKMIYGKLVPYVIDNFDNSKISYTVFPISAEITRAVTTINL